MPHAGESTLPAAAGDPSFPAAKSDAVAEAALGAAASLLAAAPLASAETLPAVLERLLCAAALPRAAAAEEVHNLAGSPHMLIHR